MIQSYPSENGLQTAREIADEVMHPEKLHDAKKRFAILRLRDVRRSEMQEILHDDPRFRELTDAMDAAGRAGDAGLYVSLQIARAKYLGENETLRRLSYRYADAEAMIKQSN